MLGCSSKKDRMWVGERRERIGCRGVGGICGVVLSIELRILVLDLYGKDGGFKRGNGNSMKTKVRKVVKGEG